MPDASTIVSMSRSLALKSPDILALNRLARQMIAAGLWTSADRANDLHCDCIEIATDAISGPSLSIGILASGRYFYMDHRSSAVHLGDDLDDVLTQAGLSFAA
jgi:hypothetical protein